jgi:hypothetical protein
VKEAMFRSVQAKFCVFARVTRLGKFPPIGQQFTLGRDLKITEVAQIFWLLFFSTAQDIY